MIQNLSFFVLIEKISMPIKSYVPFRIISSKNSNCCRTNPLEVLILEKMKSFILTYFLLFMMAVYQCSAWDLSSLYGQSGHVLKSQWEKILETQSKLLHSMENMFPYKSVTSKDSELSDFDASEIPLLATKFFYLVDLGDKFEMRATVPDAKPEDFDVSIIDGKMLRIEYDQRFEKSTTNLKFTSTSKWHKTIDLGFDVKSDDVLVEYDGKTLKVSIRKPEQLIPRKEYAQITRIPVHEISEKA